MTYHFIGIGGIGMSGLARMLLQKSKIVTGSDVASSYVTDGLIKAGAQIFFGHAKEHVPEGATVIYTSDIPQDNPEFVHAKEKKYPLLHRSDLLLKLMDAHKILAVSGTHGKTTTTSLLIHVFQTAGLDPSFAVGGVMMGLQINAAYGSGDYFIAEADESDGTFLKYPYDRAIITNIDNDHLAHYGSWENLVEGFKTFIKMAKAPDSLVYCLDDPTLAALEIQGTSYGFSEKADFCLSNFSQVGYEIVFDIQTANATYKEVRCKLTGRHNALNSTAVFALALACGISEEAIRKAFSTFGGVKRRLEKKGEAKGILAIDDYAHHPTEIRATLKAVKAANVDRPIVALFQPHRYSRMRYCMKDFDHIFESADLVVVTDLFTAKEAPVEGVSTEAIVQEIQKTCKTCRHIPRATLVQEVAKILPQGAVVITLGAGDITKVGTELIEHVQRS